MKPNLVAREGGNSPIKSPNPQYIPGAGLTADTVVLSQDGESPVAFLSAGDGVISRDAGLVTIRSIDRVADLFRCVSIAAGSLGGTRPDQDMVMPEGQMLLIRDWWGGPVVGLSRDG